MFKKAPYDHDIVQVVKLGSHYQVKYLRDYRLSGFEDTIDFGLGDDIIPPRFYKEKKLNTKKLANNISRAISKCREYALSNNWEYFVTLTIDSKKYNRFDLESFWIDFAAWIKQINRKYHCHVDYLIVPERHKNNAWHFHGLFAGLPSVLVTRNLYGYYDLPSYSDRFGFISLDSVRSQQAVAFYITKHLSKQIYNGVFRLGKHLYFHSRGLSSGVVISLLRASDLPENFTFQYESEDNTFKSSYFEDDTFLKSIGLL